MRLVRALIGIMIFLDRYLNAMSGGEWPETISCRYARRRLTGCRLAWLFCFLLDLVDPGHCERSLRHYDNLKDKDDA